MMSAGTRHPRMQLLTVEELLAGAGVDMPPSRDMRTFKKAPKAAKGKAPHPELSFDPEALDGPLE